MWALAPSCAPISRHSRLCSTAWSPDRLVGVAQAAKLVGVLLPRLILEGIGVGGVDEQAPGRGKRLQLRRALGTIPRNVQGHAGRDAHEPKDRLAVLELLEDRLRFAGRRKPSEARTTGGQRPGRHGDAKRHREISDHLDRDAAPGELLPEMRVIVIQGRAAALVVFGDAFVGQREAHDVRQRGNAVTFPASTFRTLPVDLPDRSDAKKYTASATSSGYTLRFNRLRVPIELLYLAGRCGCSRPARRASGRPRSVNRGSPRRD